MWSCFKEFVGQMIGALIVGFVIGGIVWLVIQIQDHQNAEDERAKAAQFEL